jgi:hypothetical protein
MRRGFWLLVLSVGLMCPAHAAEPAVRIGPGVYTFPEIARKLSVGGRKVRCSKSLSNRAAFLSLRPRPWSETCSLISRGLNVRVQPDPGGGCLMVPDPAVQARERRWQERYTSYFRSRVDEQVARWRQKYLSRPREQWVREFDELWRHLSDLEEQASAAGPEGLEGVPEIEEYPRLAQAAYKIDELLSPATGALLESLQGEWPARELLQRGWVARTAASPGGTWPGIRLADFQRKWDELRDTGWFVLERPRPGPVPDLAPEVFKPYNQAVFGVTYNGGTEELAGGFHLSSANDTMGWDLGPDRWLGSKRIPDLEQNFDAVFAALGPDAVAWLKSEREATERFLQSEGAGEAFDTGGASDSLSELVETWSRKSKTEVIMELWPGREMAFWAMGPGRVLSTGPSYRLTLRQLFGGMETLLSLEPLGDPARRQAGRQYRREVPEWSLRELDGVLVVSNRLAFLDRLQALPLAAFVQLERRCLPESISGRPVMPYGAVVAYCRAVKAEENAAWLLHTGPFASAYRGVPIVEISLAQPLLRLFEELPLPVRTEVWRRLRALPPGEDVEVPLRLFPLPARNAYLASVRACGLQYPLAWDPRFTGNLEHCALSIEVIPEEEASRCWQLRMSLGMPGNEPWRPLFVRL